MDVVMDVDVVNVLWREVYLLLTTSQTNGSRIPSKSNVENQEVDWAYLQSRSECR